MIMEHVAAECSTAFCWSLQFRERSAVEELLVKVHVKGSTVEVSTEDQRETRKVRSRHMFYLKQ